MKKIWNSLWNKRKLEGGTFYEQELEEVQGEFDSGRNSNYLDNSCDLIDATSENLPIFAAIQQHDTDELSSLLNKSPNLVNNTKCGGLTPLHLVCHTKNLQILQKILNHSALVSQLDDAGNTALHIAVTEKWHEGVRELLQHGASPDMKCQPPESSKGKTVEETPLHTAVRMGDLTSTSLMLEYEADLTLCDGNKCSVLHLAAQSLNVQILLQLLEEKSCQDLLSVNDCKGNCVMHAVLMTPADAADKTTREEVFRVLFEAGVDVNSVNFQNETPVYHAARAGLDKAVAFLISLGAGLQILTSKKQSVLHGACISGNATCLKQLLDDKRSHDLVTKADDEGNEPFCYAVRSSSIDCCELLLRNGDHLTRKNKNGNTRCSLILDYLPSGPKLLRDMFDKCIKFSDKPQHDPDYRITFDYSILLSPNQDSKNPLQSSLIYELNSKDENESLLKHPLIESFLYRKWEKIKFFFYINFFIFFIFLLLHSFYIISVYKNNPMEFSKNVSNVWVFRFLHIFMYMLIVVPEIIVSVSHPGRLVKHWETLTKSISLVSSAFVVFLPQSPQDLGIETVNNMTSNSVEPGSSNENVVSFQRHMAAVSAFFGWVELMMLCGRFPALGAYTLMFTRIAKSMLLFILAFITLLIGFAICFLVLFYEKDSFSSIWLSIMKTLMMMVGEIEYESLVAGKTPFISYVSLVAFLFLVNILVVNLLIGLAVNDISNLELLGKIERLSKQASYLVSLERLVIFLSNWKISPGRFTNFLGRCMGIEPELYISLNKRRFRTNWKYKIPAEIIEAALAIEASKDSQICHENKTNEEEIQKTLSKVLTMMEKLSSKDANVHEAAK